MEAGRYHVAKAPGKNPRAWHLDYPRDVERVWAMLERLEKELRATGKPCLPTENLKQPGGAS
jgi:hypothetical protein